MSILYVRLEIDPAAAARVRVPLLERLLARAAAPPASGDWRRAAFAAIAGPGEPLPAVAAAALCAAVGRTSAPWVCVASPVHVVAGMRSVSMPPDGPLRLDVAEVERLAADFGRVFEGTGLRLVVGRGGCLLCEFGQAMPADTHEPRAVAGHDVWEFLPRGPAGGALRRHMSEFEMWLFEHPVNRARAARGAPAITGLWLWGGGATLDRLPSIRGWSVGDDPLFGALGALGAFGAGDTGAGRGLGAAVDTGAMLDADAEPGARVMPGAGAARDADATLGDALAAAAGTSNGVVVLDVSPGAAAWPAVERDWLAPALAELRAGRLETLWISAGDRSFELTARRSRYFWRTARPWWEWLGAMPLDGTPQHHDQAPSNETA